MFGFNDNLLEVAGFSLYSQVYQCQDDIHSSGLGLGSC